MNIPASPVLLLGLAVVACGSAPPADATGVEEPAPSADQDIAAVRAACAAEDPNTFGRLERWPAGGPGTVDPVPIPHPRTPDIIYVMAGEPASSLYASIDGGRSYCPLSAPALAWVVVAPSNPRVLFGAVRAELFTSEDAGRTWQRAGAALPSDQGATPVLVHPGRADTLFTPARADFTMAGTVVFERSDDGGASWTTVRVAAGLPLLINDVQLAVGPGRPGALYLTAYTQYPDIDLVGSRLQVSRDEGATWRSHPLPPLPTRERPALLATSDGRLVLTADRVWTSNTDGQAWQPATVAPFLDSPRPFAPARGPAGTFYLTGGNAGQFTILKTANGGVSWREVPLPAGFQPTARAATFAGGTIYLPSWTGLQRTEDDGRSWDLRWLTVQGTLAASADGSRLFGTFPGALFFSSDGSESWSARPTLIPALRGAVGPADPSTLYLTTQEPTENQQRLQKSSDGGVTWTELPGFQRVSSVTVASDGTAFVAETTVDPPVYGVYRSGERGTFTRVLSEVIDELELAADQKRLYATWANNDSCRSDLPGFGADCIRDVLFVSDDRGASWRARKVIAGPGGLLPPNPRGGGAGQIMALATHATDPATLAVVVAGQGVFVSHDAGATFEQLPAPGRAGPEFTVGSLAISGDMLFFAWDDPRLAGEPPLLGHPLAATGDWIDIGSSARLPRLSMVRGPAGSLLVGTERGLFRYRPAR